MIYVDNDTYIRYEPVYIGTLRVVHMCYYTPYRFPFVFETFGGSWSSHGFLHSIVSEFFCSHDPLVSSHLISSHLISHRTDDLLFTTALSTCTCGSPRAPEQQLI